MVEKYFISRGTKVGELKKEFYTDRSGSRKTRLRGYVFLGIFGERGFGLEIMVYRIPKDALPAWKEEELYRIRSGRKTIGYFVKRKAEKYSYLKGKIELGGLKVKIAAYPEGADSYTIELSEPIECGVLRLSS